MCFRLLVGFWCPSKRTLSFYCPIEILQLQSQRFNSFRLLRLLLRWWYVFLGGRWVCFDGGDRLFEGWSGLFPFLQGNLYLPFRLLLLLQCALLGKLLCVGFCLLVVSASQDEHSFTHGIGPLIVQFFDGLQFLEGLAHLLQDDGESFLFVLALPPAADVLAECGFIVDLRVVESGRCLVGDHDVPLQVVRLHLLQQVQHARLRVGLEVDRGEEALQLGLVLLLRLDQLLLEEPENPVHGVTGNDDIIYTTQYIYLQLDGVESGLELTKRRIEQKVKKPPLKWVNLRSFGLYSESLLGEGRQAASSLHLVVEK